MKHKKTITSLVALACGIFMPAQGQEAAWLRYPALSPDGRTIAFNYKGDIYTVDVQGGYATRLTTDAAWDGVPVWSPNSRQIAFKSMRNGSADLYVTDRNGGVPRRLTFGSGTETPMTWLNDSTVLYQSVVMGTKESVIFPGGQFPQVWAVTLSAQRPTLYSALPMEDLNINASGQVLYHDMKGYEDKFRKHHISPIARDIWMEDKGAFRKLTDFGGEDRTPRWDASGQGFYYLSERSGTMNVYHRDAAGKEEQLTQFAHHPVRSLTVGKDDLLCYSWDGALYVQPKGGTPQLLSVRIAADYNDKELIRQRLYYGATEVAVSPSGKEVAFVVHGDVYVTTTEYRTTQRITDTPEEERSVSFSPDGRSLIYASERGGNWQIYRATLAKKGETMFSYATEVQEEALMPDTHVQQLPAYSPDGKSVAYFEDRATLKVLDVDKKKARTVLDGKYNYSYVDGDIEFAWSPDSKWLLSSTIGTGGWQNKDIALVKADGSGEVHNLTESGYVDGNAKWVLGGKAMLFSSDRAGYRSHGSWGAERDVYIMFFDVDAYDEFVMSREDKAMYDAAKNDDKEEKKDKDEKKKQDDKEKVKELKFDLENCRDRVIRLTANSSNLGDFVLDKKGENLYYQSAVEGGYDLWRHQLKDRSTQIVVKGFGGGGMVTDKNEENVYFVSGGIKKYTLGGNGTKNIDFEAEFNYRPFAERAYLFDHTWRLVKEKFYDPSLHGVDWEYYGREYKKFLPYINNNHDFAELLSELLGELNASHTGSGYRAPGADFSTARLGLIYDAQWAGDGLKVSEVLAGGPFTVKQTEMRAGYIIEKIDGEEIGRKDVSTLLDGKAGRNVRLDVLDPKKDKRYTMVVKAISAGWEQELLYRRWVKRNEALVDSLSGGRLAYVHVRAMNSDSYRSTFSTLLSDKNRNREAVIVDERHNGGGWLHDDLCTLLSGKEYQRFVPNGRYIGSDPWNKWTKPSCVLMCEDDYSNGQGFPQVYKTLGIGKLIGAPMAGTMTAVWWETLMDRSMYIGVPQVGCQKMDGTFAENQTLYPDITVYNTPEDYLGGHDRQLEAAIKEMLRQADAAKEKAK